MSRYNTVNVTFLKKIIGLFGILYGLGYPKKGQVDKGLPQQGKPGGILASCSVTNRPLFDKMMEVMVPMFLAVQGTLLKDVAITWNDITEQNLGNGINSMKGILAKGVWEEDADNPTKFGKGLFRPHFMALRAILPSAATPEDYKAKTKKEPTLWTDFEAMLKEQRCYVLPNTPDGKNYNVWFGPAGYQPEYGNGAC
mgnify:CR=1 FL=1